MRKSKTANILIMEEKHNPLYNWKHKDLDDYRNKIGLPPQFLLSAGWILSHKNQKILLEACASLKKKGPGR